MSKSAGTFKKAALTALFVLAGLCLSSCITSEDDSVKVGIASVIMPLSEEDQIPQGLDFLLLLVTGPGMENMTQKLDMGAIEKGEAPTFELDVPTGRNRTFGITAFNEENVIAYQGIETLDLLSGRAKILNIDLYGQGYIFGTIYWIDTDGTPGEPLRSYEDPSSSIPISTNNEGRYIVNLPTRKDPYTIYADPRKEAEDYETYATVDLPKGGTQTERDLYLIPQVDIDHPDLQPWICGVTPMTVSAGDAVQIYGRGFDAEETVDKRDMRNDNLQVIFKQGSVEVASESLTIENNIHLEAIVPDYGNWQKGAAELNVKWENEDMPSNIIPITIIP